MHINILYAIIFLFIFHICINSDLFVTIQQWKSGSIVSVTARVFAEDESLY